MSQSVKNNEAKKKERKLTSLFSQLVFYDLAVVSLPFAPTETLVSVKQPAGIQTQQDL